MNSWTEKIKSGWAKIKTIKNIEIIIGIVIICLIVLIYSSVSSKTESTKTKIPDGSKYSESATELEKRLGDILSEIDGAGKVSVMITFETERGVNQNQTDEEGAMIKGVVIVADGAESIKVRINLVTATKTLLNINAESIQIFDRK